MSNFIDTRSRIDGVVLGTLADMGPDGAPRVAVPALGRGAVVAARATVAVGRDDIGAQVALMFEAGDPDRPIVMGLIVDPSAPDPAAAEIPVLTGTGAQRATVTVDDGPPQDFRLIEGKEMIVLKCGRASITLTKEGKVLIRGAYVSSRSSGVNRIKGGSVQLN